MTEGNEIILIYSAVDLSLPDKIATLPKKPGVYRFKDENGTVIYVGKARNLHNRVQQYFQKSRSYDKRMDVLVSKIKDIELTVTDSEVEALILESNLIKKYKPRYNVIFKDDKSYPYITITDEPYPRIFVTRRKTGNGRYYGPYTDAKSMRISLNTVRNIFYVRSCNYDLTEDSIAKRRFKVCLDYHIKKCEGPCEGLVTRDRYIQKINQASRVLRGRIKDVSDTLIKEIEALSENRRYEEAAVVRDKLNALSIYLQKQKVIDETEINRDIIGIVSKDNNACSVIFSVREGKLIGSMHIYISNSGNATPSELLENLIEHYYMDCEDIPDELLLPYKIESRQIIADWMTGKSGHRVTIDDPESGDKMKMIKLVTTNAQYWLDELDLIKLKRSESASLTLKTLQNNLGMENPPKRIECFDISNIQGKDSVASLVVFIDGKARKSEYRKFNIRTVEGPDDYASMQEVIERRYKRLIKEGGPLPDLIMVDGGKAQLSVSVEVLERLEIKSTPVIGLAKRLEEIFLPHKDEPLLLPRTSVGLRLLQKIRDEAHRFAVSQHRKLRSKRILSTELDLIKGIGKKRAKELLEAFGSIQGVRFATEEQLAEIVGYTTAKRISEYFENIPTE
jgi:excinuclease ABC subunit C